LDGGLGMNASMEAAFLKHRSRAGAAP
jgi:hypothetical protein